MPFLQDLIHKTEVAGGLRYVRYALAFLVAALVLIGYNLRVAKNFGTQEAMDSAQLARNLSEGQGYKTSFVRPLSMHLVADRNAVIGQTKDLPGIKEGHPDIANPPVYPVVLAGLMKVLPFQFNMATTKAFWSNAGRAWRYQPDFLIQWFNELLFLVVIGLTYLWARRMFDLAVARTAAVALFGSELLWRFSAAGLSTMLLLLIFVGIVWSLTWLQQELLEPTRGPGALLCLAFVTGLLVGLGGLTRYGFGWLILPTLLIPLLFADKRRVALSLTLLLGFALVMAPWLVRNYLVSGTLFGTAGCHVLEGASLFPDYRLERSLHPEIQYPLRALWMKLLINSRLILQTEFFTFSGGWLTGLFLVGLLVSFRNPILRQMRYFVVGSLGIFFVVQALGRTQLSEDSPVINSENLLVLLLPLVAVYAVSLFYLLLDQISVPMKQVRYAVWIFFMFLVYLPLIFALLPPRTMPLAYPPYYPPAIRKVADAFRPSEMIMSDIPWAVAWYGNRQSVWLTLNAISNPSDPNEKEDFFAINDFSKPINGLYLTSKTLNAPFQSEIASGSATSWGRLVLATLLSKDAKGEPVVPAPFPLRKVAPGYLPEQMFVSDWARWTKAER